MRTDFRVTAIPAWDLDRIRRRGTDDFGNAVVATTIRDQGGTPLRCCLRDAAIGERVALIGWQPATTGGPYAEVGPVFIHADACGGYPDIDAYPSGFRHRRQIFRAYDADGRQVDNILVEGRNAEGAIADLFARPEVTHLHSRNVLPGCYMFTVARPPAASRG